ncbi:LemA family protein [Candidatus Micrarchaeota archaeon]|nr:LemA family protein [Candidatus Micrarchaeota archaeon]
MTRWYYARYSGLGALGTIGLCFIGILFLVIIFVVLTYNRLVQLKVRIENSWAQIDVQLKRRYDLIPNLIETVKGYVKHERGTFEEITKLRTQIVTGTPQQKAKANDMLSGALKSIFAVAENYPQLKANENFKALQDELAGTENKISYVRMAYNDTVMQYNTEIKMVPTNIIAGIFNFTQQEFFKTEEAEKENVKVEF